MAIRIVRLGTTRAPDEGTRIGSVRRPPRGVAKSQYASGNWYDVWLPLLAPSAELVAQALSAKSEREWAAFARKYQREMKARDAAHTLDLLAMLSHHANFSLGCYCENEQRCHRSLLRELLRRRGALLVTR